MRIVHSRADAVSRHPDIVDTGTLRTQMETTRVAFVHSGFWPLDMDDRKILHVTWHRKRMVVGGVLNGIRPAFLVCSGEVVSNTVSYSRDLWLHTLRDWENYNSRSIDRNKRTDVRDYAGRLYLSPDQGL